MPNILEAASPQPTQSSPQESISQELVDNGVNFENLKVLDYLGMKDRIFDREIMDKVSKIADFVQDKDIQEIDLKLGNPYGVSRLDKIYSYILLEQQEVDLAKKRELINREKQRYNMF